MSPLLLTPPLLCVAEYAAWTELNLQVRTEGQEWPKAADNTKQGESGKQSLGAKDDSDERGQCIYSHARGAQRTTLHGALGTVHLVVLR